MNSKTISVPLNLQPQNRVLSKEEFYQLQYRLRKEYDFNINNKLMIEINIIFN